MPVSVAPYNPEWKKRFDELREPIWAEISDLAVDIVHVGSTSIEGMSAKQVIDIDIVIDDWGKLKDITERLRILGYVHVGNLGIKEREVFNLEKKPLHDHHLYVTHRDSVAYRNHILLRKHLSENPDAFRRYRDLKLSLASTAADIDKYTQLKTDLILEFLKAEGLPDKDLDEIRSENLSCMNNWCTV